MAVFDCFTFFNEDIILRARLSLLRDVVDRFVIVEADRTHRGEPRELVFPTVRATLEVPDEQITYVAVSDLPRSPDPWVLETAQRRAILRGLRDASDDDLILISDADEIPRPKIVAQLARSLEEPAALALMMSYYRVNLGSIGEPWTLSRASRFRDLGDPNDLRMRRDVPTVPDAGWHLSYLGDERKVVTKLNSFAHQEYANERWTSAVHIERSIRLGVRLFGETVFDVLPDHACIPTITRTHYPDLFHPGRSRFQTVLAHCYRISATHRGSISNRLTDRAPLAAFPLALLLHLLAWSKARLRSRSRLMESLRISSGGAA